jgi:hypothetical protein
MEVNETGRTRNIICRNLDECRAVLGGFNTPKTE